VINGVFDNGQWCEDYEVVKVREIFKDRFDKYEEILVRLGNVSFNSITEDANSMLVGFFSEEEVKSIIWSCDSSKSPSPDDFDFGFIKFGWEFLKVDIISTVNEFTIRGSWPEGLIHRSFVCFPRSIVPNSLVILNLYLWLVVYIKLYQSS